MDAFKEELVKEAKRIEEDALYSAKGHFSAANTWRNAHFWLGIPATGMAAAAGAIAPGPFAATVAAPMAILVAALTAVATFLNPGERANAHRVSGNRYSSLRNRSRMFCRIDVCGGSSDEDLRKQLGALAGLRDDLNTNSPQIPPRAFRQARKGIEEGEADYEVDRR